MSQNTITGTVTATVVLGTGQYGDSLKITTTGVIDPSTPGDTAIIAPKSLGHADIVNLGHVTGGRGSTSYQYRNDNGGTGIDLATTSSLTNHGVITGGSGVYGYYLGGTGGVGVDLEVAGTVANRGLIAGGDGGSSFVVGGAGGAALRDPGGTFANTGTLVGGDGGLANPGVGYIVHRGGPDHGVGRYQAGGGGAGGAGVIFGTAGHFSNAGTIEGGAGGGAYFHSAPGGAGGIGVDLSKGGNFVNHGTILGGQAGYNPYGLSNNAGAGLSAAASARIVNFGAISGGTASSPAYAGTGVDLTSGSVVNHGVITGGATSRPVAIGGTGIAFTGAGMVINDGTIAARAGSDTGDENNGRGGFGILFGGTGTVINHGIISGGYSPAPGAIGPGGDAVVFRESGKLTNFGTIAAGGGSIFGGEEAGSGIGVYLAGSSGSVVNRGLIAGGTAIANPHGFSGYGGDGILLELASASTVVNTGTVIGGAGGAWDGYFAGNGGVGVALEYGKNCSATNSGTIIGGAGGEGGIAGSGNYAAGGDGLLLGFSGSTADNTGLIAGGAAGQGGTSNGGNGAEVDYECSLTNAGTISGGAGSSGGAGVGGNGGAGVYIDNGEATTSGTILGGAAGIGNDGAGSQGDAVQFGSQFGSTLVVDPGAVFGGDIVAVSSVDDTLELAGKTLGTLTGFGTTITGLTTIAEDADANWKLTGSMTGTGTIDIGADARLTLGGAVSIASIAFAAGGDASLHLNDPTKLTSVFSGFGSGDSIFLASIQAASLSYSGGVLTLFDASHAVVDTLSFAGSYSQSDFGLQANGGGTDVVFTGTDILPVIPDFLLHGSGETGALRDMADAGSHIGNAIETADLFRLMTGVWHVH
jgi:hypothetical protein